MVSDGLSEIAEASYEVEAWLVVKAEGKTRAQVERAVKTALAAVGKVEGVVVYE